MKRPLYTKPHLQPLYLFDYDGVWVKISEDSFSIMRHAIGGVLDRFTSRRAEEMNTLNWKQIFDDTKGTTEHTFVTTVFNALGIQQTAQDSLFTQFIQERASLISQYNEKHGLRTFDDHNVFMDTQAMVAHIKQRIPDALFGLVTGNPLWVVEQRLPAHLQDIFHIRIGGEYGKTRKDMLDLAVVHAKQIGWNGYRDASWMYVNAFYFDDAKLGALSGLEAGFKTVFLDRLPDQEPNSRLIDESVLNHILEPSLTAKFGGAKTNRILYGEMYRSMPSLFTTASLDNYWLLKPKEHEGKYMGWLDPDAHAPWKVRLDEREHTMAKEQI